MVLISGIDGKVEPFGNFEDLDYSSSLFNGVHLTPDKQYSGTNFELLFE